MKELFIQRKWYIAQCMTALARHKTFMVTLIIWIRMRTQKVTYTIYIVYNYILKVSMM